MTDIPAPLMPDTCGTCHHWLEQPVAGVCRRYPPTPFIIGTAPASVIHNPKNPGPPQLITQSLFPQMNANGSCGEHQPKERTQ